MRLRAVLLLLTPVLYAESVAGTIANSVTHGPIAGVKVTLAGPRTYTAVTDAAGTFSFPDVQAGDYTADFNNASSFNPPPTRKTLHVGTAPVRIDWGLEPLGRIQGRILSADGSPIPHADLWLVFNGGMMSKTVGDDGRFTADALIAGVYHLMARAPRGSKSKDGETWAPTYYPNTTERSQAEPIRVGAGADLTGYEIRLRSVPAFKIQGSVRDDTGKAVAGAAVQIVPAERNAGLEQEIKSDENGLFEFRGVWAGDWLLFANSQQAGIELKGVANATVARHDVDRVDIRLARPFSLHGFVDRDGPRDSKGERKGSGVAIHRAGPQHELVGIGFAKQDGTIVIDQLYPGRYTLEPVGFAPGYYVDSVKLGDRDVLGLEVELFDGVPPLRISYKADAPSVRGTVENGSGATVMLFPQDEALVTGQFIRTTNVGSDGRFEIGSLRPGDYYAFAFNRIEWLAFNDAGFFRGLVPLAERVHVAKGETATVELKVTLWPE